MTGAWTSGVAAVVAAVMLGTLAVVLYCRVLFGLCRAILRDAERTAAAILGRPDPDTET